MLILALLAALLAGPATPPERLFLACRTGDTVTIRELLHSGVNVDARHELTGWTGLIAACFYGHADAVQMLLAAGADPNAADRNGGTPLMKAVQMPGTADEEMVRRKVEIVKQLLAAGADPQRKDKLGGTAWETALLNEEASLVNVFAAARVPGVREALLMRAIAAGNAEDVARWIADGADVNSRDDQGWNAVSEAALAGDPSILQKVLDAGGRVDARFEHDWTPLMIAASKNHADAVGVLLKAGADASLKSAEGLTALDIAVASGSADAARLLSPPQ